MPDESLSPPKPPTPFIGREDELRWLQNQIGNRKGGLGTPIVISGPPGIGKTALAARYVHGSERISIGFAGEFKQGKSSVVNAMLGEELAPNSSAGPGNGRRGAVWVAARTFSGDYREFEELMRFAARCPIRPRLSCSTA